VTDWELLENGESVSIIDFGRPETGSKNIKILQLHNKSTFWEIHNIELDITKDTDYKIDFPKSLRPNEIRDVTVSWKPKFERREPLNISQLFIGDLLIG